MEETRFSDVSSPDTIVNLNDDRLRRSEENARGWRRNLMVIPIHIVAAMSYWLMRSLLAPQFEPAEAEPDVKRYAFGLCVSKTLGNT
jgi:hypothetical protein